MRQWISSRWLGYGLAVVGTLLAVMLRWGLGIAVGEALPVYITFYPVVICSALLSGVGAGVFATFLSAMATILAFITPNWSLSEVTGAEVAGLALFCGINLAISIMGGRLRAARRREQAESDRCKAATDELIKAVHMLDLTTALILDLNGRIIRWNTGSQRLYGFSSEQAVGQISHHLLRTRFPQSLEAIRLALLDTGRWEGELVHTAADGREIVVASEWVLIRNEAGQPAAILEVNSDITARKQAEEALRASEERFRGTFENAAVGIGRIDREGRILRVNQKFREMLGYHCHELAGRRFADLTHPEDREADVTRFAAMMRGETESYTLEKRYLRVDGQPLWVLVTRSLQRDQEGRPAWSISVVQDITARKLAEQALRDSELFYRQMLESIPGMVFTTRPDGYCDYQSQQWVDYTGVPMGEHLGDGWNQLLHPEDRHRAYAAWQAAVEGKAPYDLEYRVRRHDGQYEWFKAIGRPIRDETGKVVRWFGIATNIETLKRAEEGLRDARRSAERAKAAAEEASRAKDHFLAVLSHELRTPLTPVLATLELLRSEPHLDHETRQSLELIHRNAELEARLIDDLLDLTRIARGKIELNKRFMPLCEVILHAVEVCQPDLEARQLHFAIDMGEAAPYLVEADSARLQQVFWNLLKNAIKFTPQGGRVGIRCRPLNGHHVVAEVSDNGQGIEPEALGRIFRPFEQAEHSIARQFGGLGLGLAISKALVEMHGGSIEAHSTGKGKGATFRLRLPLARSPESRGWSPGGAQSAPGGHDSALSTQDSGPSRPLRVLLVEDHGDTAKIMTRLLTRRGCKVQTAADVATAIELAVGQDFDLLVSDLGLPDRSGLDLIRELRSQGRSLPAIALSGYGQEEDVRRSREAGFHAHLTKPVDFEQFYRTIAEVASAYLAT